MIYNLFLLFSSYQVNINENSLRNHRAISQLVRNLRKYYKKEREKEISGMIDTDLIVKNEIKAA